MTGEMPRPRPQYLHREITRHGEVTWYFRRRPWPRVRLRAAYGTPEFQAEYDAALLGQPAVTPPKVRSGSLRWLWDRYRESQAWAVLSDATRRQRENIMEHVLAKAGDEPFAEIDETDIEAGKDKRAATPAQARNYLDLMRGLFRWAKKNNHVRKDPTSGVSNPKRKKGKGFPAWNEDDVARYQQHWPIGTRQRVWLDMLLYTGPRRGDVSRLGRQHIRTIIDQKTKAVTKEIAFKTEKGGELIEVTIPLLPVLETTLAAGPCGDLTFIVGTNGHGLTKETFGNYFSAAAREAGVNKSAHGVRKIAATTAADNGATIHQLMALFGWVTTQMAELYTREANRRRLAREAGHLLLADIRDKGADAA